ncbi:TRAP transporter substrate-binding protein DctP [Pseudohoeflea coraliihabitans]|uniref:TRAP transporter substrate-binding protein DctP n=1 Tax=Pseudohoeflea coraliihabitans TaxID=2860393 RepID=A0ABS6WJB8_9HYPH|nr:TRAP transporter substrate-binding protein DctP [Pseudohoeflea sp. DP4N28-3]MBW3096034.1 TRAP transporter substrate-binding protein DctP [Pseudohoeflea sp. DP4N28-3]
MKRLLIGLGMLVCAGYQSAGAEPITLKWAGPAPADDSQVLAIELMGDYLEKTAPSVFNIEVYPAGTLVKQAGVLPSLQSGGIELAYVNAFDVASQVPEYGALTAAYSVRDPLHMCSVLNGKIGAEFGEALEQKAGLVPLGATLFGIRHVSLREGKDVNSPADLAGVKQREPASEAWQLQGRSLGANPTPTAFGEIFLSLQTGAIDAHSLPIPTSYRLKLHEVTDQVVLTGHYMNHLVLVVSKQVWDQLDDRQKGLLQEAADVARIYNDRKKMRDEMELRSVFEDAGITFTEPDVAAFAEHARKVYAESEFAKGWLDGLAQRLADTPSDNPRCFHLMNQQ